MANNVISIVRETDGIAPVTNQLTVTTVPSEASDDLLRKAQAAFDVGDYPTAERLCGSILLLNSGSSKALALQALAKRAAKVESEIEKRQ